jgi:VanZ family protein
MGVIYAFSSQPSDELPDFGLYDLLVKKGGHMLGYAILAWLFSRSWEGFHFSPRNVFLLTFFAAVLYAVSDEIHQSFVPGRHPSAVDVVIDGTGAMIGLWVRKILPASLQKTAPSDGR